MKNERLHADPIQTLPVADHVIIQKIISVERFRSLFQTAALVFLPEGTVERTVSDQILLQAPEIIPRALETGSGVA